MAPDRLLSAGQNAHDDSDDGGVDEALLTGRHVNRKESKNKSGFARWRTPLITTWAAIATISKQFSYMIYNMQIRFDSNESVL